MDLIEAYFTITAGGNSTRVWCRSTYSDETLATATVYLPLAAGENAVTLTNDGEVTFNGKTPVSPTLQSVQICPLCP